MSESLRLSKLLNNLNPVLDEHLYVFVCTQDLDKIGLQDILCLYKEKEGITLVLPQEIANIHELEYSEIYAKISLQVYSSLNDVGLTAAVSTQLGNYNIPCNVIAAYHHDHIFVPANQKKEAMKALLGLQ
ncbi:MAG: hypothetical protein ACI9FN_001216 [Saprospiraceae bacterium]|jgi:hypothetical protein